MAGMIEGCREASSCGAAGRLAPPCGRRWPLLFAANSFFNSFLSFFKSATC
jgi:hypothetical protein